MDSSSGPPIGSMISHYRILSHLGTGGMGAVYRARDERLDRDVALKVLLAESVDDVTARARLVREARMASSLNHPHIAHVYEVGEDGERLFIAMELVEGRTLRASIPAAGMHAETLLRQGAQIADALAYAHERGVIHRDLKSANIMIGPDGWVKVLDFGLAKRLPLKGKAEETQDINLTATGIVMGTPNYLPPEVLSGEPADARGDIWALGVVLYEMVSGKLPFSGGSLGGLWEAILNGAPSPLTRRVPVGIQALIGRCLAKDPGRRYRQGNEARAAIEALIGASASGGAGGVPRAVWVTGAGIAAVALAWAVALGTGVVRNPFPGRADRTRFESLAVLPLANLSGDPGQEYFADGMTEELITDLASIPSLKVISRTSVMRFKNAKESLRDIARSLGVEAIIEGSVQRAGDRVRITAQLIEVSRDRHLWARSFERDFRDVLALQSDVAREIAKEIQLQISPQATARLASRRPINPEAYELYLKGRFEWNRLTDESVRKGIEYFERALAIDPGDARYNSGLADAYVVLVQVMGSVPQREGMAKVKEYAGRALAADESVAEAHSSMAAALFFGDWNSVEAERHLLRAMELNPGYSTARLIYSAVLSAAGRIDEAIEQDRRAIEVDPWSLLINWNASGTFFNGHRYDEAVAAARRALEIEPGSVFVRSSMLRVYEQKGDYEAALDLLEKYLPKEDGGKAQAARMRQAYMARGPAGYWQTALHFRVSHAKSNPASPVAYAFLYTHVGDHARAIDYLERAFEEHVGDMLFIRVEPSFDPLRGDPRFQALVRRMDPHLLPARPS
ncbi:MAG: tetratricopeptide repeat protein [Candidatus Eisenbacteria bacterium]|uniref:Tetratricopeptide repeat protein n=1 Tax=Eiseniibacteriota bacterium TaxID=2212470 RepID=A0A538T0P5_UNCEI|nr:MAG: tetratricopeptide repeat protein [Candidatus Eisenbacteria bacterium]